MIILSLFTHSNITPIPHVFFFCLSETQKHNFEGWWLMINLLSFSKKNKKKKQSMPLWTVVQNNLKKPS